MSLPFLTEWLVATIVALLPHPAEPLRICAEPDSLPMSQQSSQSGFEIEVAQRLAKDLGRPLEVRWIAQRDPSYYRSTVGAGVCDAVMSVPSGFSHLDTTKPWYHASFAFVTRDAPLPQSFNDPELAKVTIGVPATGRGEPPPAISLTRRDLGGQLHPYSIYEPRALVEAVADREVDMAVLWGPFAGYYGARQKVPLKVGATPDVDMGMPMGFDISIGVKKGNDALKDQLDAALVRERPAIAAILGRWHVPTKES